MNEATTNQIDTDKLNRYLPNVLAACEASLYLLEKEAQGETLAAEDLRLAVRLLLDLGIVSELDPAEYHSNEEEIAELKQTITASEAEKAAGINTTQEEVKQRITERITNHKVKQVQIRA